MKAPSSKRLLGRASLVLTALAITACGGSTTTPPVTPPQTRASAPALSSDVQLATLRVGPSVTQQSLASALPDARVMLFNSQLGRAVVELPARDSTLEASHVTEQALSGLDAGILAMEENQTFNPLSDTEGASVTTWAGGVSTWAGGVLTWAGGQTFLSSSNYSDVTKYWNKLNLSQAHTLIPEKGKGIVVAVLDTGIDPNHPLLRDRLDSANDWDYIGNDGNPAEVKGSKYGHGTAVAGTILMIAPEAKIQANRILRADGTGSLNTLISAISDAVDYGADIINLSLGTGIDSTALNTAIQSAINNGVPVVAAAGNTGTENLVYPARKAKSTTFPEYSGFIAVGSVNMSGYKSSFTSYGLNMSLNVPGEAILAAYPNSQLAKVSGTSFSTPAVSGALALILSASPTATPANLAQNLLLNTSANVDATWNSKLGRGMLNVGKFADAYR